MKPLPIVWQRLVTPEGKTCDRCQTTHEEVRRAVAKLTEMLRPAGVQPCLEIREIDEGNFKARPLESNRIWIAGRAMEEWIGASVGSSRCCSACGDADCRTIDVDGNTYETVPEEILIKAGLIAAVRSLGPPKAPEPHRPWGPMSPSGRARIAVRSETTRWEHRTPPTAAIAD